MRKAIGGKKRLAIALHWFASGGSYESIADMYNVGHASVCVIALHVMPTA